MEHNYDDHVHNHANGNKVERTCSCGDTCHACVAEKLCITSGCDMEAKQFDRPSSDLRSIAVKMVGAGGPGERTFQWNTQ